MNALLQTLAPYQGAALALVAYLVTSLWIGAAVTVLAMLVVRFWQPLDAAARYTVWYVALIAVLLGPLAATVAMQRAQHGPTPEQFTAALRTALDARAPLTLPAPSRGARAEISVPPAVAYGAAVLWLLIVLVGASRFVAGAFVLARLKRDALPLSPERRAALPLWRSHANVPEARRARLCVSDRVEVPVAVGLFDGMVVIPQQVMDDFDPSDVDRFVLHELAHLERRDDWTAAVQRLVQVVMFFNPAVHVIARCLDLEREIACDDRVVAATSDVRSYAVGLTRMAESTAWPHRGIAAPAIFITRRQLSLRVEQLLTGRRSAAGRLAIGPAIVALTASLGICVAAAPLAPSIGIGDATDHLPDLTQIRKTEVIFFHRDGTKTTLNSEQTRVFVLRGDRATIPLPVKLR
jgi:beta-lactamase regulating signal transducer with metallopeptidase domain